MAVARLALGLWPLGQLPLVGTVGAVLPRQPPWEQDRHIPWEREAVKPDRRAASRACCNRLWRAPFRKASKFQNVALGMDRSRLGNT